MTPFPSFFPATKCTTTKLFLFQAKLSCALNQQNRCFFTSGAMFKQGAFCWGIDAPIPYDDASQKTLRGSLNWCFHLFVLGTNSFLRSRERKREKRTAFVCHSVSIFFVHLPLIENTRAHTCLALTRSRSLSRLFLFFSSRDFPRSKSTLFRSNNHHQGDAAHTALDAFVKDCEMRDVSLLDRGLESMTFLSSLFFSLFSQHGRVFSLASPRDIYSSSPLE